MRKYVEFSAVYDEVLKLIKRKVLNLILILFVGKARVIQLRYILMMKFFLALLIFIFSSARAETLSLSGKVEAQDGCSPKAMVWLSLDKENYKERLLLMHTEVPLGGSFSFYLKPGDYQLRGSDEAGCQFLQKISLKKPLENLTVKLVKP
jgi:hypothetical protein